MKRSFLDADSERLDGSECIAAASGVSQVMMEGSTLGSDKLQVTMVTVFKPACCHSLVCDFQQAQQVAFFIDRSASPTYTHTHTHTVDNTPQGSI